MGFSFGMTSGVITTMGLMIGLFSGTSSKSIIIGGILTIAIADAFSDALGIHISEESENVHTGKEIWMSTIMTFLSKFLFASTFIIPFLFLNLILAVYVNIFWGFLVLGIASYYLAKIQKESKIKVILEHILIAIFVIIISHFIGVFISKKFS